MIVISEKVEGNSRVVSTGQTSVVLVGGGIVNLITAHYLALSGYSIAIYDASPDFAEVVGDLFVRNSYTDCYI